MTHEPETERLRFRQFTEGDVEGYYEFFADPVTQITHPPDMNRGIVWREIAKILGHWTIRGFGLWALEDKASGRFAGYAGLWFPGDFEDIEVGYGLHPAFRGRGYAVEAARRARDYGYLERNFKRIVSYIQPINQQSIRVAEKTRRCTIRCLLPAGQAPHDLPSPKTLTSKRQSRRTKTWQ